MKLSSGDSFSLGPLLTSVSPPRFSEPEREEFKPAGYRDSDSEDRRRKEMQEMWPRKLKDQGGKGISASLALPFWSKSASGGKREPGLLLWLQTGRENSTGKRNRDDSKGKAGTCPSLFQRPLGYYCFSLPGYCFRFCFHETNTGCLGWGTSLNPSSCLRGRKNPDQIPFTQP